MCADHHDFVSQIGARNVSQQIERIQLVDGGRFRVKHRVDVQLHAHRKPFVENADHPVVMFDGDGDRGHQAAGVLVSGTAATDENGAPISPLGLVGQPGTDAPH